MRIDVSRLTPEERRAFEESIDRILDESPDAGPTRFSEEIDRSIMLAAEYAAEKGHPPELELTVPGADTNYGAWLRARHEREEAEEEAREQAEREARRQEALIELEDEIAESRNFRPYRGPLPGLTPIGGKQAGAKGGRVPR